MIRRATADDLGSLIPLAKQFVGETKHAKPISEEVFIRSWTGLLETDAAAIFLLLDDVGDPAGAIGGVVFPDMTSGELVATEFFWFVGAGARGRGGMALYREFQRWAEEKKAAEIRMANLCDVMAEKHDKVYRRLGFQPVEVMWRKELVAA